MIDIIPWQAGSKYPTRNYDIKEGDYVYVLDVWIHRGIGPNDDNFLCPARNYNDPCAVCDYIRDLRESEEATDEQIKALDGKRRVAYLIQCHDSEKEYDKGIQMYEVAHWFMERHLTELARVPGSRGAPVGWIGFASPDKDEGRSISFKREGTGNNTQFIAHQFQNRDYDVPQETLDQTFSLDEHLMIPTYQELEDALYGGSSREEVTAERPAREEEPVRQPTKPSARAGENPCPIGLQFGVDTDKYKECDECPEDIWKACAKEKVRLEEAGDKKEKPSAKAGLQRRDR
ncbi:MAG: hypothetical protein ACXABY_37180 [Candidatus Thorarchaeota archaeon]